MTMLKHAIFDEPHKVEPRDAGLMGLLRFTLRAMVRARTHEQLFQEVCGAAVEQCGFAMCWVGFGDADSKIIVPVAQAGDRAGYLKVTQLYCDDRPEGLGPAGVAYRSGQVNVCNDFKADPKTRLWHQRARRHGYLSVGVVPLRLQYSVCAILVLYSARAGCFSDRDRELLGELGAAISFAMDTMAREARHLDTVAVANRFFGIAESSLDAIVSHSFDGKITSWNPAAERMFGYAAEEILGQDVSVLIPVEKPEEAKEFLAGIAAADPVVDVEAVRVRKNGERFSVFLSVVPIRSGTGTVVGGLTILRDLSESQIAQEHLRTFQARFDVVLERTAELATAKDRAETSDRLKSAFLTTMSHELRTPLHSILGFCSLLEQQASGPINAEQATQLGLMNASAQHLLRLINDILDMSTIDSGQLQLFPEPYDLFLSLRKIIALVKPLADQKGLALRFDFQESSARILVSDQRRVEQVVLNLLANAVKFTDEGEIALISDVVSGPGLIVGSAPRSFMRLRIVDSGIGIKPKDLARLFRPFRQIGTGAERRREGSGLGLAICRRLADLLGGDVEVESEPGRGSVFTFTVPVNNIAAIP